MNLKENKLRLVGDGKEMDVPFSDAEGEKLMDQLMEKADVICEKERIKNRSFSLQFYFFLTSYNIKTLKEVKPRH